MWLFWLIVILPIIEIALFIQVGGLIGLWPTLALVILSAMAGTALMRSQGAHAWAEAQASLNELRDPTRPLAHGLMIVFAGMLLVIPGFFTDAIGLLLLIPAVRNALMRRMAKRIRVTRAGMGREPHRPPYGDGVIDGDYVVEDDGQQANPRGRRDLPSDLPADLPDDQGGKPGGGSGWTRH